MTDTDTRSVRVMVPGWHGQKITGTMRRRVRVRALCALSGVLTRDHLETEGEVRFRLQKDDSGLWMTATANVRSHTWRTYRERELTPCRHCGRRNFGVHLTASGAWECKDTTRCAHRAARARHCRLCGAVGTAWTIRRTDAGDSCKDRSLCAPAPAVVMT